MKQYRITKYDPATSQPDGTYLVDDEWTSYQDINDLVSEKEYSKYEAAYIKTAIEFLIENQVDSIKIQDLFDPDNVSNLKNKQTVPVSLLENHLKNVLREKYTCKFGNDNCFIHIGWDFYMYVGVTNKPSKAVDFAKRNRLFVEKFKSPYLKT